MCVRVCVCVCVCVYIKYLKMLECFYSGMAASIYYILSKHTSSQEPG